MGIYGDIRVGHQRICGNISGYRGIYGYIRMVIDGDVHGHTRIYGISGIYGDILAGHMWIYGDIWVYGEDIWAGPSQPP